MDENTPLVLVTGSFGYVAAHCVKQLLEEGSYRVRGTVRSLKNEEYRKCTVLHFTIYMDSREACLAADRGGISLS